MTHVITQNCCADARCVDVCPVNCIHPLPGSGEFATAEMLFIDPGLCIDCGACADVCPVGAISPDDELTAPQLPYVELNAEAFRDPAYVRDRRRREGPARLDVAGSVRSRLDVAIVGSGPSACYAAEELLSIDGVAVSVTMFERLMVPWGLARFGVAPDHQATKDVVAVFERLAARPGFSMVLGTEVGTDVHPQELLGAFHAVVYAVGLPNDRRLGLPGEDLPGSHAASEIVAWYNGHPSFADRVFDLSTDRAVIIGNGNVALDVARILLADPNALARTDISDHALEQLAESSVREVVLVGRRGPAEAAFTVPELWGAAGHRDFDVRVLRSEVDDFGPVAEWDAKASRKWRAVQALPDAESGDGGALSLRFGWSPVEVLGGSRVEGVRFRRNSLRYEDGQARIEPTELTTVLACGLVIRSVGYEGGPLPGLPFDAVRRRIPSAGGRIVDLETGEVVRRAYVAGWVKRGASGLLGTNRHCSRESVEAIVHDLRSGLLDVALDEPLRREILGRSGPGIEAWHRIDSYERAAGRAESRPRVKVVSTESMNRIARTVGEREVGNVEGARRAP